MIVVGNSLCQDWVSSDLLLDVIAQIFNGWFDMNQVVDLVIELFEDRLKLGWKIGCASSRRTPPAASISPILSSFSSAIVLQ